jgi:uncharacterized protein
MASKPTDARATVEAAVPADGIVVDKDVAVALRDGACLKADVLRPDADGRFPAILNLGPYQKNKLWMPPDDLEEQPNPLMNWETINPQWWIPKGYVAVRIDARRTGKSSGQTDPWSFQESLDFYDAIEWACAAALVLGRGWLVRDFLFRNQSVVRREPSAAVAESDYSLGRLCGSLS